MSQHECLSTTSCNALSSFSIEGVAILRTCPSSSTRPRASCDMWNALVRLLQPRTAAEIYAEIFRFILAVLTGDTINCGGLYIRGIGDVLAQKIEGKAVSLRTFKIGIIRSTILQSCCNQFAYAVHCPKATTFLVQVIDRRRLALTTLYGAAIISGKRCFLLHAILRFQAHCKF